MDERMEQTEMVMPGDKIGVEEEFQAGDNAYVDDDGTVRSAIVGRASAENGRMNVRNPGHEIKKIKRGMFVLGTVTDDMRTVTFVKIDDIHVNGVEYMALKDGKIVAPRSPPPGRGGFRERGGERGRDRGPRQMEREAPRKSCGIGDVILARVAYDDPDIYTLSLNDRETGVVYAACELCGTHMNVESESMLSCPECRHKEGRKVSSLYGKAEEIKKLFMEYK